MSDKNRRNGELVKDGGVGSSIIECAPLKRAVVFGTGKMACGLLGEILYESGYRTLFIGRRPEIINAINRIHGYFVGVSGVSNHWINVRDCHAVSIQNVETIIQAVVNADIVFTSVGIDNIPAIAPLIAKGLWKRIKQKRDIVNIIASENLPGTGSYLRHQIVGAVSLQNALLVDHTVGFSAALTHRIMTGGDILDGKLHYTVDVPGDLIIDKRGLIQPLPTLYHSNVSAEFDALFLEKLSTINLVQAVASYLGHLHGCHYVHEAILHPEISQTVKLAAAEATAAFKAEFPHLGATIEYDAKEAITRITDSGLGDTIARICKGPQRKLAAQERLIGPARLAARHGLAYDNLALAIAAALLYYDDNDLQSKIMQNIIASEGVDKILTDVCGLLPYEALAQKVKYNWARLQGERFAVANHASNHHPGDMRL